MTKTFVCVYCGGTKCPSIEHVVPAALGGTMELSGAVCRECNQRFSSEFEQSTMRRLALFRSLWVNPTLEKRPFSFPATVVDGAGLDGRTIGLTRDGTFVPPKPFLVSKEKTEEGYVETWRVPSPADEAAVRKSFLRRHPNGSWEIGQYKEHGVLVEVDLGMGIVGSVDAHRLATKIAFSYLAYRLGPEVCRRHEFDKARSFVGSSRVTDFSVCDIVASEAIERAVATLVPYHSITLVSDSKRGRMWAVIALFGLFFFLVTLADRRRCIAWWYSHEFDPATGIATDRELVKDLGIPRCNQRPSANKEEFATRATAATNRAMERLRASQPPEHVGEQP